MTVIKIIPVNIPNIFDLFLFFYKINYILYRSSNNYEASKKGIFKNHHLIMRNFAIQHSKNCDAPSTYCVREGTLVCG